MITNIFQVRHDLNVLVFTNNTQFYNVRIVCDSVIPDCMACTVNFGTTECTDCGSKTISSDKAQCYSKYIQNIYEHVQQDNQWFLTKISTFFGGIENILMAIRRYIDLNTM